MDALIYFFSLYASVLFVSLLITIVMVMWEFRFRIVHLDKKTRSKQPINWVRFILIRWLITFLVLMVISLIKFFLKS